MEIIIIKKTKYVGLTYEIRLCSLQHERQNQGKKVFADRFDRFEKKKVCPIRIDSAEVMSRAPSCFPDGSLELTVHLHEQ